MTAAQTIPQALTQLGQAYAADIAAHLGISKALVRRHLAAMSNKPVGNPDRAIVVKWVRVNGCTKYTGLWSLSPHGDPARTPGPGDRRTPKPRHAVARRGPDWSIIPAWHPSVSRFSPIQSQVMP